MYTSRLQFPYTNRYAISHPAETTKWYWHEAREFFQRGAYGYAQSDFWSLDAYLVSIILPGLRYLRDFGVSYPANLPSMELWRERLDWMIVGFEAAKKIIESDYDYADQAEHSRLQCEFKNGMTWFTEYFFALWD